MNRDAKFEDLFGDALETVYDAETRIVDALPAMIAASSSEELAAAFAAHLEQTRAHVVRLQEIFQEMGQEPRARESGGLKGLLADGERFIAEIGKSPTLDLALATGARKVEHWEMVAYESLSSLAEVLGQQEAVDRLHKTLDEESEADETLADIADSILDGDAIADEDEKVQHGTR